MAEAAQRLSLRRNGDGDGGDGCFNWSFLLVGTAGVAGELRRRWVVSAGAPTLRNKATKRGWWLVVFAIEWEMKMGLLFLFFSSSAAGNVGFMFGLGLIIIRLKANYNLGLNLELSINL
ncbi:hypothetical protein Pfo_015443, partial [Paulownia fortunei]